MNSLIQQIINGLILGSTYGLIAIGYTMVYGLLSLINFAHGEVFMIGGFGGLTIWSYMGSPHGNSMFYILPIMLLCGGLCSAITSVSVERFIYRPLRNAPSLVIIISAIGASILLQEMIRLRYPNGTRALYFPDVSNKYYKLFNAHIDIESVLLLLVSFVLMVCLSIFVKYSKTGRALRAVEQDKDAASLMGININYIITITFAIGGFLAGIASVLQGIRLHSIDFYIGFIAGLKAFTAVVLGGIGNIYGAMFGGIILGLFETLTSAYIQYIPGLSHLSGDTWKDVWSFIILILILLVRPHGLFGNKKSNRV